jgi:GxxExxY protein
MNEEQIITAILDEAFYVHKKLGPGMLESVYKTCLGLRLRNRGLLVEYEKSVPVTFEDIRIDHAFRVDMLVENKVVTEIKRVESIADVHVAQALTYLRLLKLRYGLILNFNEALMRDGIKRVLNGYY